MSDVRIVTASEATKRDGVHTGVSGTIRAEDVERELRPSAPTTRPLSPREHMLAEAGHLPEAVAANPQMGERIVPTVKTDADVFREAHRAAREGDAAQVERRGAEREAASREALADDYRRHVAKVEGMARDARGDSGREARAAQAIRETAALGEALKARGVIA